MISINWARLDELYGAWDCTSRDPMIWGRVEWFNGSGLVLGCRFRQLMTVLAFLHAGHTWTTKRLKVRLPQAKTFAGARLETMPDAVVC